MFAGTKYFVGHQRSGSINSCDGADIQHTAHVTDLSAAQGNRAGVA